MIYSNNIGIATDRILIEVARFQPSASVPTSLKKTVIGVCNNILNKSKKLDREDKKVDRALKAIEGAITLAKDNSYTDNAYPIEIHSAITNGEACMDYAISVVRAMGFKHSNMKEGKKGQTWYKVSGNDILIASLIGTLFSNSMVTIILHAVDNSDHNNDILNGILESVALTEGQQAEEYKARKAKAAKENARKEDRTAAHRKERDIGYKTRRYDIITGEPTSSNFMAGYKKEDEDKMISDNQNKAKAAKVFNREIERRYKDTSGKVRKIEKDEDDCITDRSWHDFTKAADATMRHVRRHPKQYKEGTIFESVEFI